MPKSRNTLERLGESLQKVFTTQSSYINGPDVDWQDVAAQVMLQAEGLHFLDSDEYRLIVDDLDEPIPYTLTDKARSNAAG